MIWFARRIPVGMLTDTAARMFHLASELMADMPPGQRDGAVYDVLDAMASVFTAREQPMPEWLTELRGGDTVPPVTIFEELERRALMEMMRTPLRAAAQERTVTALASELGVTRHRLRRVLAGSDVRRGAEWDSYTNFVLTTRISVLPTLGPIGLSIAMAEFPVPVREDLRCFLARRLQGWLGHHRVPEPVWVEREADWPVL